MELEDYIKMAKTLAKIKGSFILSINDLPEIRQVFKGFNIKPVELKYSAARKGPTKGKELLISNF